MEQLFKLHYQSIFNFVYHYVMNKSDAEDIVQDVFIKYFRTHHKLRNNTNHKSYLFTIAHNQCMNYFKHKNIRDGNNVKLNEAISFLIEHEYDSVYDDLLHILTLSMDKLTPIQQQIIKYKLEGKDYNTIAQDMDISRDLVHKNIKKAYSVIKGTAKYNLVLLCLEHTLF